MSRKGTLILLLLIILGLGLSFPFVAMAGNIKILLSNGENIGSSAIIKEGHLLVPMRPVLEALGADVQWNPHTNTAIGIHETAELQFPIGSISPTVNEKTYFTPVPVQLLNNKTFIPFSVIAQTFKENIKWEREAQTIVISGTRRCQAANHKPPIKIDINKASLEELQQVSGISKELAQKILEYRAVNGHFRNFEQLKNIPGIGGAPLANLKDSISITYTQRGLASWYGSKFHGKRTSSGEIFNMYANTAAHRTLPFGSQVKVTFLKTGKSIWVKINDRGPHNSSRIMDLSKNAADTLGLTSYGLGEVKLTIITN